MTRVLGDPAFAAGVRRDEAREISADPRLVAREQRLAELFRFETNVVLRAGAGSGKTEALASLAARLLAGVDRSSAIPPERLVALTFTEKAAAEMRDRIRRRLDDLGAPVALEQARIGTIHGFCASLLRAHALEAGLVPTFTILDDAGARRLARRSAARAIASAIRTSQPARDLVEDARRTWSAARHLPPGLGDLVVSALISTAETGLSTSDLLLRSPYAAERSAASIGTAARRLGLRPEDAREGRVDAAIDRVIAEHVRAIETDERVRPAARAPAIERCRALAARWRTRTRLDERRRLAGVAVEIASLLPRSVKSAAWLVALRERALVLALHPIAQAHAESFVALVADAAARYEAEKHARAELDFGDILVRAHALLRDRVDVRRAVGAEHDALLVDEAQDTSPIQGELVRLLHEDANRPGNLRDRGLLLVGDRKQSIYGFRGADVGVLDALTHELVEGGGRELPLRECFRSVPSLVETTNALAGALLVPEDAASPKPFEVVFDGELDALVAIRAPLPDAPERATELLVLDPEGTTAADLRREETRAIARQIAELVERGETRFGDVALLLPRMTHVGQYGDAFDAFSVPFVVEGGRGLLETEECRDLLALATVLSGDIDPIAVAAVLRSPFVALSDVTLAAMLTVRTKPITRLSELLALAPTDWPAATAPEIARLGRFAAAATDAARSLDDRGIGRALRDVVDHTAYDAVLSALPDGPGRVANLDALLESAARHDGDPRAWSRLQRERIAAGETEREADLATDAMDVVHVMTIHQAKGREFPVVVVADTARPHAEPPRFVAWDSTLGLAVRVPLPTGGTWLHRDAQAVVDRARHRERAERSRVFYVAVTRARDRLVLGDTSAAAKAIVAPQL